jgi:hypothetical protein
MFNVRRAFTAILLSALVAFPGGAMAQEGVRWTIGTGFGGTLPISDLDEFVNPGWHAQANLGVRHVDWPASLRFDFVYHSLGAETGDNDLRVLAGLANVEFRLTRTGSDGGFFLVAGPGIYTLKFEGATDGDTEFGVFGGLGYKIAMTNLLLSLEGKFHNIFGENDSIRIIPFSIVAEIPVGEN